MQSVDMSPTLFAEFTRVSFTRRWDNIFDLPANMGYGEVEIARKNISKSLFASQYALSSFPRMPFKLCNASDVLQRVMNVTQSLVEW